MKMAKWADYCISAVKYNDSRTHIIAVQVRVHDGASISGATEWARGTVVSSIDDGKTFVTITMTSDGKNWNKGKDVHVVKVNNVKYIRTDSNNKASDNLENLPELK
jgi:Protein of unknown function (DUF3892)